MSHASRGSTDYCSVQNKPSILIKFEPRMPSGLGALMLASLNYIIIYTLLTVYKL